MKIPVKAAIFDLDGTVLNSSAVWDGLAERFLRSMGVAPEKGLSQLLESMDLTQSSQYLAEKYPLSLSAGEIHAGLLKMIEDFYRFECQLKRGAAEILSELRTKGIKTAAATAGDFSLAAAALERLGIFEYFEKIFTCEQYGNKNRPDIFLAAADFLKASSRECVVFEDSLFAVITAKSAGFITAAVCDISERNRSELQNAADYYREDLSCYTELFRKL